MKQSRCPACNPMHGTHGVFRGGGRGREKECSLCKGSKLVEVEVAKRYVERLARGSVATGSVVDAAVSTVFGRQRGGRGGDW